MSEQTLFQGLVAWLGAFLVAAVIVGVHNGGAPRETRAGHGLERFVWHDGPTALPAIRFNDGEGTGRSLEDFKGRVVLLNLWATWCAPCVEEMPALDRLDAALGGSRFAVLAVSLDHDPATARRWLKDHKIRHLEFYHDPRFELSSALRAPGLPLSVLIDAEGRELGRLAGSADWDAPAARALVARALASSPTPAR